MGPFLLALLIAGCIVLWVAAPPNIPWSAFWEKPEFWQTWLPTWLQGVGTVGAAYVAWKAFSTWRGQDAGRRQAIAAEELLKATHRALAAGRAVRTFRTYQRPVDEEIEKILRDFPPRIEAFDAALGALDSHAVLAREHFGEDCASAIDSMRSISRKFKMAIFMLHYGYGDDREERAQHHLDVVSEPLDNERIKPDEIEDRFQDCVTRI